MRKQHQLTNKKHRICHLATSPPILESLLIFLIYIQQTTPLYTDLTCDYYGIL